VTCLFCNKPRARKIVTCAGCSHFLMYQNELWFKELLRLDRIQRRISSYEVSNLSYVVKSSDALGDVYFRRNVGAPQKLSTADKKFIRETYYEEQLSIRKLQQKLKDECGVIVSRETVRRVLK
jgi:hypothetical protein